MSEEGNGPARPGAPWLRAAALRGGRKPAARTLQCQPLQGASRKRSVAIEEQDGAVLTVVLFGRGRMKRRVRVGPLHRLQVVALVVLRVDRLIPVSQCVLLGCLLGCSDY